MDRLRSHATPVQQPSNIPALRRQGSIDSVMPSPLDSQIVRSRASASAPVQSLNTRTFLNNPDSEWIVRQNNAQHWEYVLAKDESTDRSKGDTEKENPLADQPLLIDGQMRVFKDPSSWRLRERMKTVSMALILCLNVGVDPPDVVRIEPCAQRECWIDPLTFPNRKLAVEEVGARLQAQFTDLSKQNPSQQKTLCHVRLDPQLKMVHDAVTKTRHAAKEKRALFYYNGHGVPRPTNDGEIWVYDDKYTQYMPLSVRDLMVWMGKPSVYIFDCGSAGTLLQSFKFAADQAREQREATVNNAKSDQTRAEKELQHHRTRLHQLKTKGTDASTTPNNTTTHALPSAMAAAESAVAKAKTNATRATDALAAVKASNTWTTRYEYVVFLACSPGESLPTSPQLPADLFTSCMSTPLKIALHWYIVENPMTMDSIGVKQSMVDYIPGTAQDRKSPLGELRWTFTAIADTIAWQALPQDMFQRLFRQDTLVATLFRNFLLADRIMRKVGCTPKCLPELPPTWQHPMWVSWDMALENLLTQLPNLLPKLFADEETGRGNDTGSVSEEGPMSNSAVYRGSPLNNRAMIRVPTTAQPPEPNNVTNIAQTEGRGNVTRTGHNQQQQQPANRNKNTGTAVAGGLGVQMPRALNPTIVPNSTQGNATTANRAQSGTQTQTQQQQRPAPLTLYHFRPCRFFANELQVFSMWLRHGGEFGRMAGQLPVVLQMLLSQAHRIPALRLMARFMDFGPCSVSLVLSLGVLPYVHKLLASPSTVEQQPVLVHIWAKIVAFDRTCRADLVKSINNDVFYGCDYVIELLKSPLMLKPPNKPSYHRQGPIAPIGGAGGVGVGGGGMSRVMSSSSVNAFAQSGGNAKEGSGPAPFGTALSTARMGGFPRVMSKGALSRTISVNSNEGNSVSGSGNSGGGGMVVMSIPLAPERASSSSSGFGIGLSPSIGPEYDEIGAAEAAAAAVEANRKTEEELVRVNAAAREPFLELCTEFTRRTNQRVRMGVIISIIAHESPHGQAVLLERGFLAACALHLGPSLPACSKTTSVNVESNLNGHPQDLQEALANLKMWLLYAVAAIVRGFGRARAQVVADGMFDTMVALLGDRSPQVRAATVHALGALIGSHTEAAPGHQLHAARNAQATHNRSQSGGGTRQQQSTSIQAQQFHHQRRKSNGVGGGINGASRVGGGLANATQTPNEPNGLNQTHQQPTTETTPSVAADIKWDCTIVETLVNHLAKEACPLVRREAVLALSHLVVDRRHCEPLLFAMIEMDRIVPFESADEISPAKMNNPRVNTDPRVEETRNPFGGREKARAGLFTRLVADKHIKNCKQNTRMYLSVLARLHCCVVEESFPAVAETAAGLFSFIHSLMSQEVNAVKVRSERGANTLESIVLAKEVIDQRFRRNNTRISISSSTKLDGGGGGPSPSSRNTPGTSFSSVSAIAHLNGGGSVGGFNGSINGSIEPSVGAKLSARRRSPAFRPMAQSMGNASGNQPGGHQSSQAGSERGGDAHPNGSGEKGSAAGSATIVDSELRARLKNLGLYSQLFERAISYVGQPGCFTYSVHVDKEFNATCGRGVRAAQLDEDDPLDEQEKLKIVNERRVHLLVNAAVVLRNKGAQWAHMPIEDYVSDPGSALSPSLNVPQTRPMPMGAMPLRGNVPIGATCGWNDADTTTASDVAHPLTPEQQQQQLSWASSGRGSSAVVARFSGASAHGSAGGIVPSSTASAVPCLLGHVLTDSASDDEDGEGGGGFLSWDDDSDASLEDVLFAQDDSRSLGHQSEDDDMIDDESGFGNAGFQSSSADSRYGSRRNRRRRRAGAGAAYGWRLGGRYRDVESSGGGGEGSSVGDFGITWRNGRMSQTSENDTNRNSMNDENERDREVEPNHNGNDIRSGTSTFTSMSENNNNPGRSHRVPPSVDSSSSRGGGGQHRHGYDEDVASRGGIDRHRGVGNSTISSTSSTAADTKTDGLDGDQQFDGVTGEKNHSQTETPVLSMELQKRLKKLTATNPPGVQTSQNILVAGLQVSSSGSNLAALSNTYEQSTTASSTETLVESAESVLAMEFACLPANMPIHVTSTKSDPSASRPNTTPPLKSMAPSTSILSSSSSSLARLASSVGIGNGGVEIISDTPLLRLRSSMIVPVDRRVGVPSCMSFHPHNHMLVVGGQNGTVSVIHGDTGKVLCNFPNSPSLTGSFTAASGESLSTPASATVSQVNTPRGIQAGRLRSNGTSTPTAAKAPAKTVSSALHATLTRESPEKSITSLGWINETSLPLMYTASTDGHVRIWRNVVPSLGGEENSTASLVFSIGGGGGGTNSGAGINTGGSVGGPGTPGTIVGISSVDHNSPYNVPNSPRDLLAGSPGRAGVGLSSGLGAPSMLSIGTSAASFASPTSSFMFSGRTSYGFSTYFDPANRNRVGGGVVGGGGTGTGALMVASWKYPFDDSTKGHHAHAPIAVEWQPHAGHMLCGMNDTVKVWDLEAQLPVDEIRIASVYHTRVSCIASTCTSVTGTGTGTFVDSGGILCGESESLVVVGLSSGSVVMFDKRASMQSVGNVKGKGASILGLQISSLSGAGAGGGAVPVNVLSADKDGKIESWDIRVLANQSSSIPFRGGLELYHNTDMSTVSFHRFAPVFATAGKNYGIDLVNMAGSNVARLRHNESFMRQKTGKVSALAFHPFKMLLASALSDGAISVYSANV